MAKYKLYINENVYEIETDPGMPLLWALRDIIGLKGTKFGCGLGMCGACTVHLDGRPIRSCQASIASLNDKRITTIEGLAKAGLHPVQEAWIELQVPQCGYCQSGQIMSAAALLSKNPMPNSEEINVAMNGNLCRCGTYDRIKKGIAMAAEKMSKTK